ncbi:ABC transporter permease [Schlesneria paludicola]|uniref:ABC transporter permease n=1 Tax=Schlesneria paludicola TaxID=360056 RepID=UPI00029B46EB|nr:ABC transporter permease [Schlesneria paludicola]
MFKSIVQRELTSLLRRKRMMVLQSGLVILFGLLVALRWPTDARVAMTGTRSQQVFLLFSAGLMATMLFLLPVFPSTSLVKERKQGTLALLLNTPLGPFRIYFGKLASVLMIAGMILAMSLPAASACYAMGGLSLYKDLFRIYLLLGLVALEYSALALLISSFATTIDGAVRTTYGTVLALSVLTLGPHYFFQGTTGLSADIGELLRCLSPLSALMSLTGAGDAGNQGLTTKVDLLGRFLISSLTVTVIASIWTISRLNHTIFDRNRSAGTISDDQTASVQAVRRVFFLIDPQRRSSGISSWVNPMMVKEFRCRRFGRLHWLIRLVSVCAMLSLGLTYAATAGTLDWGVETIGGIMVVMQVALVILITPSLAAGLISSERESRGWQLLRTTPMSVFRIVWGKLLSVILPLMLILCATLPGYVVMVYIEPGMSLQVQRVVICLVATAVFAMLLSAAVGSLFLRTAAATAAAYGALLSICCLPLLIWMGRDAPFGHSTVEAALSINPIAAALSVIRMPGFQNYTLIPVNWWFMGIFSLVSLCVLLGQSYRISRPQ